MLNSMLNSLSPYIGRRAIRKNVGAFLRCRSVEDYSSDERREIWPAAKELSTKYIKNCRMVQNRVALLEHIPKCGKCAEIGVMYGDFSQEILRATTPEKLHLIDLHRPSIEGAKTRFASEMACGQVEVHLGDSSAIVSEFPESSLDWIYIDGDHAYEGVKRDLEASRHAVKPDGLIVLNDYQYFSIVEFMKYGVIEAVNEFCLQYDWEIIYFALQGRMYNDVILRRIQ